MNNVWTDPVERVGSGRRRHLYTVRRGDLLGRRCGTVDHVNGTRTSMSKSDLERIDAIEFAKDPNACRRCKTVAGLDDIDVPSAGAATVEYDPFGVNGGDAELDGEFTLEGDQDQSDRVEADAEPGPGDENPGAEGVELSFDEGDVDRVPDRAIDLTDQDVEFSGTFTVDLDAMDDDALTAWVTMFFDIPPGVVQYLLDRPGAPDDPASEDAIQGLKTATRYAEQSPDIRRSTGAAVSEAYHELKDAIDAAGGDVDV